MFKIINGENRKNSYINKNPYKIKKEVRKIDNIEIVKSYKKGEHIHQIASRIGASQKTVSKILSEEGVVKVRSPHRKLFYFPEDIIEKYTVQNLSSDKIGKEYGVCDRTIIKILEFNKIPIKKHGQKTFRDVNFFKEIDSEEKAYVLGLLRSDGNISDDGTIQLVQSSERKDIVEILAKILNVPILYFDKRDEYRVSFRQLTWVEDLEKHGIVPRKSHTSPGLKIEHIPKKFQKDYIRGLFDGDGLCYFNQGSLILGFCSSFKLDVEEFFDWFESDQVFNIHFGTVYFSSRSNSEWVSYFYEKVYKEATLYGSLKRERVLERIAK